MKETHFENVNNIDQKSIKVKNKFFKNIDKKGLVTYVCAFLEGKHEVLLKMPITK